jgi:hypothetical protein
MNRPTDHPVDVPPRPFPYLLRSCWEQDAVATVLNQGNGLGQNQAIDFGERRVEHSDGVGLPRRELSPTPAEWTARGGVHTHSLDSPDLETV